MLSKLLLPKSRLEIEAPENPNADFVDVVSALEHGAMGADTPAVDVASLQPVRGQGADTAGVTVVVVGGGGDGGILDSRIGQTYADRFSGSLFLTHGEADDRAAALERIVERQRQNGGGPVVLVGHSWGGPSSYRLTQALGDAGVDYRLITADPVGRRRQDMPPPPGGWTNVGAVPEGRLSRNDMIAEIGGRPSRLPVDQADRNYSVEADHGDLNRVMNARYRGGPSAEEVIWGLIEDGRRRRDGEPEYDLDQLNRAW